MKRSFLISLFTLTLFSGAMGVVHLPTAHAALGDTCDSPSSPCGDGFTCDVNIAHNPPPGGTYGTCIAGTATPNPGDDPNYKPKTNEVPTDPNFDNAKSLNGAMGVIMSIFAWLLGVAAITLDNAVYYTVVTMGNYVHGLSAVGVAWRILRDLGNIFLIFGFLAIGITTILDVDWYGGGKKMLPMLLFAAIFLNFSLFISEAVIDVGNLFATQFYTAINAGQPASAEDYKNISDNGISVMLMNQLGLSTIYGNARSGTSHLFDGSNSVIVGFMAILLFMIAAFVMFSLAFILIARFVALVFIIVVAPIGFAGLAIPKLKGMAEQWWEQLFAQTITAPVLLLLLYVALAVITDAKFLTGFNVTAADALTGMFGNPNPETVASFAGLILSFLVAMGLLLAVMYFAKRMSAFGAGAAMKLGGLASFGAVSLAGRGALGSAGLALSSKRVKAWASKGGVGRSLLVSSGKLLSNRTYDFRNIPGAGTALGGFGITPGSASLTASGTREGYEKFGKYQKEQKAEYAAAATAIEFEKTKKRLTEVQTNRTYAAESLASLEALDPAKRSPNHDLQVQGLKKNIQDYDDEIGSTLSKLSNKQIEELDSIRKGTEALVRNLSPQQFKSLMDNKDIPESQRTKIRDARIKGPAEKVQQHLATIGDANAIISNPASTAIQVADAQKEKKTAETELKTTVRQMAPSDLENAPPEFLTDDVLDQLADDTRVELIKSGRMDGATVRRLKERDPAEKVKEAFKLSGADAWTAIKSTKMKPEKIAKLPPEILLDPDVYSHFNSAILNKLPDELTSADMATLSTDLQAFLGLLGGPESVAMRKHFRGFAGSIWNMNTGTPPWPVV